MGVRGLVKWVGMEIETKEKEVGWSSGTDDLEGLFWAIQEGSSSHSD